MPRRLLWVDDEIELLKAHVMFLEGKDFKVDTVTNGEAALALVRKNKFDVMLLDESMPGMGGLETLNGIKELDPALPVIMITKNEEERLMEDAVGMKIDDYLLKPVSPIQVYTACRRLLDTERIQEGRLAPDYIREFTEIGDLIGQNTWESWLRVHQRMVAWDQEFDAFRNSGLETTHDDQRLSASQNFSKFVEENYRKWVAADPEDRMPMSPDIFSKFVAPHLRAKEKTCFFVIDCVRLDQWMIIADAVKDIFDIQWDYYMSILPTATPYSRNAIFAGMFPDDIARRYPDKWLETSKEEVSKNRYEEFFLKEQMRHLRLNEKEMHYLKIYTASEASQILKRLDSQTLPQLLAIVFNFIDILTHGRNQSEILLELVPDEAAFRSLMRSWFSRSVLRDMLVELARQGFKVVATTDHGSVLGRKASLVHGRRDTSTNLRYKFGQNLKGDAKQAIITRSPEEYRLPAENRTKTYMFAREYYYFVYPTNFRDYEKQYEGSFQHGGVSMEEMILPCLTLTPRS